MKEEPDNNSVNRKQIFTPNRRVFLKATGSACLAFGTTFANSSATSHSKSRSRAGKSLLTVTEVSVISLKAKQRKKVYQQFGKLYSEKETQKEIANETLPDLKDLVKAAIPSIKPLIVADAIDTAKSIREADELGRIKATLRFGARNIGDDRLKQTDESERAKKENETLKKRAKRVENTAKKVATSENVSPADARTVRQRLKEERTATEKSSIDDIHAWAQTNTGLYGWGRTDRESAKHIKKIAKANIKVVNEFRDQLDRHIEATNQPDSSFYVSTLVNLYNNNLELVPEWAKSQFANEKMNVQVRMKDGQQRWFYLRTKNGPVTDYAPSKISNPTLLVYTSEITIHRIVQSEDPNQAFRDALYRDDITLDGTNWASDVKFVGMAYVQDISRGVSKTVNQIKDFADTVGDKIDSLF